MNEISDEVRREIEDQLARLAERNGVRLLMAIESGSRAWGFPSPDSDYDVRFIYLRDPAEYLSLSSIRDVIELPMDQELDINGWDIRKALQLLLKHNAVVAEWMESPIRYLADDPVIARIAELADRHFDPRGYAMHYASLGRNNVDRWDMASEHTPVKRYFYSLRPALSIRALRLNPLKRPPMRLQNLMRVCDLPASLESEIEHLVELKAQTREADVAKRSRPIERLILDELENAEGIEARKGGGNFEAEANALFQWLVLG